MQMKNTTSSDILHKNSGINFAANAYTTITLDILPQLANDQTFGLLSNTSFILNDGVNDITSPSDAWNAINKIVPQNLLVTTLYELNNKDLKLARDCAEVDNTCTALITMKVPGIAGSGDGRYIEGGYATTEDYDKDDYSLVWVSDDDRIIAMGIALAMDPAATTPISDSVIQSMGVIPGIGAAFPNYPVVKNFYDEDAPSDCQGWYFWPVAQGNSLPACGETEVEAIAGWAFCPSGFYLKIKYFRKTLTSGGIRINFWWAKGS